MFILLIADGARPDTLAAAMDAGELPTFARLRAQGGGLHHVTTVFPSVTGPAYLPFLTGRFPGPVGLPGIRWFDRTGTAPGPRARSYVGWEMRYMDRDLDPRVRTLFDVAGPGMGTMQVLGRGLDPRAAIGTTLSQQVRAAWTHFRGDLRGWLAIDRDGTELAARHLRRHRPRVAVIALQTIDKLSHARGHDHALVREAMRVADAAAGRFLADAEADGRPVRLWVASDHGHSPLRAHDDLAVALRADGWRVLAHPWTWTRRADVAVMVSGNAMAHLYLDPARRQRPRDASDPRERILREWLLARPSLDLLLIPRGSGTAEVHGRGRGHARVRWTDGRFAYEPVDGDPLGLRGTLARLDTDSAWEACAHTDHPDALVQVAHLAASARAGDLVCSATPGWDFRERWEPIPHASAHGALHRDHMLVPLLLDAPPARTPRRTTDVFPSALRTLGLPVPAGLDGTAFV